MKNFNIFGFTEKFDLGGEGGGGGGGGGHERPIYRGKGLVRKREVVFLRWRGGWYPNAHYDIFLWLWS